MSRTKTARSQGTTESEVKNYVTREASSNKKINSKRTKGINKSSDEVNWTFPADLIRLGKYPYLHNSIYNFHRGVKQIHLLDAVKIDCQNVIDQLKILIDLCKASCYPDYEAIKNIRPSGGSILEYFTEGGQFTQEMMDIKWLIDVIDDNESSLNTPADDKAKVDVNINFTGRVPKSIQGVFTQKQKKELGKEIMNLHQVDKTRKDEAGHRLTTEEYKDLKKLLYLANQNPALSKVAADTIKERIQKILRQVTNSCKHASIAKLKSKNMPDTFANLVDFVKQLKDSGFHKNFGFLFEAVHAKEHNIKSGDSITIKETMMGTEATKFTATDNLAVIKEGSKEYRLGISLKMYKDDAFMSFKGGSTALTLGQYENILSIQDAKDLFAVSDKKAESMLNLDNDRVHRFEYFFVNYFILSAVGISGGDQDTSLSVESAAEVKELYKLYCSILKYTTFIIAVFGAFLKHLDQGITVDELQKHPLPMIIINKNKGVFTFDVFQELDNYIAESLVTVSPELIYPSIPSSKDYHEYRGSKIGWIKKNPGKTYEIFKDNSTIESHLETVLSGMDRSSIVGRSFFSIDIAKIMNKQNA